MLPLNRRSRSSRLAAPRLEVLEDRTALSFGTGGLAVTDVAPNNGDWVNRLAVQPADGKIIAAGRGGLARYTPGGALDGTFNPGGAVPGIVPLAYPGAAALALQPDGKIVTAGSISNGSDNDFLLRRFLPNGAPDPAFGNNGVVQTGFKKKSSEGIEAIALQPDGKIVAVGKIGSDWGVARYTAAGALDTTFNRTGWLTTAFTAGSNTNTPHAVVVQTDGRVVVAGEAYNGSANQKDFAAVRYTSAGALDSSYGSGGKTLIDFRSPQDGTYSSDRAYAMALQPDGKVVLAGGSGGSFDHFALARLNANGSLDSTFGGGGKVALDITIGFTTEVTSLEGVALQPDGKIVAVGGLSNPWVIRLTPGGVLDTTFNGTGWRVFSYTNPWISENLQGGKAVAVQPDGKVLVAGGTGQDFGLARFNADGSFDGGQPAVTIGSFTAASATVAVGGTATLTVGGLTNTYPGAVVAGVHFYYRDASGYERHLGYGIENGDGTWSLTFTVTLAPGPYTIYALAIDSVFNLSDPVALTMTVV